MRQEFQSYAMMAISFLVFVFHMNVQAQPCQLTNEINQYLLFLKTYENSEYAWPGFTLAKNIHVVANLQHNDHCAFIIENGEVTQIIETRDRLSQSLLSDAQVEKMIPIGATSEQHDKIKGFILNSILMPDWTSIPTDESSEIQTKWATELHVLARTKGLGSLFYVGIHNLENRLDMVAGLAHHEAFHHFFQSAQGQWPKWDRQPNRKAMGELCYKRTPEIYQLYKDEKDAVINAVAAQFKSNATERAKQVGVFKEKRNQRYTKLHEMGVTVSRGSTEIISCDEAEAIMEIEEGIAFFVEASANLAINYWKTEDVTNNFRGAPDLDPFYVLGAAQTFLISKERGLQQLQKKLSTSTSWQSGLFSYF